MGDFIRTDLSGARFERADLSGAELFAVNLRNARFQGGGGASRGVAGVNVRFPGKAGVG